MLNELRPAYFSNRFFTNITRCNKCAIGFACSIFIEKTMGKLKEERQAVSNGVVYTRPHEGVDRRLEPLTKPLAPQTKPNFDKALAYFSIALTGQQGRLDRMDFQTRRMFQQTVFLLQKMGTDFGYDFDLTVIGVYSKKLGQDIRDRYGETRHRSGEETRRYDFLYGTYEPLQTKYEKAEARVRELEAKLKIKDDDAPYRIGFLKKRG